MQDQMISSAIGPRNPVQKAHPNDPVNYTTTVHEQVIFTPPSSIRNGTADLSHGHNGVVVHGSQFDTRFLPQPPLDPRKTRARSSIRRAAKLLLNKSKQALSTSDSPGSTKSGNTGRNDEDSVKSRQRKSRARMGDLLNAHRYSGVRQMGKENMGVVRDDSSVYDRSERSGHFGGDMTRRFHSAENISAGSVFSSDSSHHSGSEMTHDDLSFDGTRVGGGGYALRRYSSGPIQQRNKYHHHRGYHTADSDSTDSSHRSDYIMAGQNRIGSGRRAKSTREALRKLNRNHHSLDGPQPALQRNGGVARQGPTGPLKADHNIQPFNFNERLHEMPFPARWKEQGARPKRYSSTESLETTESVSHEVLSDTAIRSDLEDHRGNRRPSRGASPSRSVRFEDEDGTPGDPLRRTLSAPLSTRRQRGGGYGHGDQRGRCRVSDGVQVPEDTGERGNRLQQSDHEFSNGDVPHSVDRLQSLESDSSPQGDRNCRGRNPNCEPSGGGFDQRDHNGRVPPQTLRYRTGSLNSPHWENGGIKNHVNEVDRGGPAPEVNGGSPISGSPGDPVKNGSITAGGLEGTSRSDQFVRGGLEAVYDEVKRAKKTYSTHAISYDDAIQAHKAWDEYKRRLQEESSRLNSLSRDPEHYSKMSGSNLSLASNSSISEKVQNLGLATKQKLGRLRRALSLDRINRSPPSDGVAKSPLKRSPSLRSLSSFLGKKKDKLMGSFTDLSSSQRRRASTFGDLNMTADIEPVNVTTPGYMRKIGRVLEVNDDGTQLVRLVKPPNGPFGFYIAKGASRNGPGIFVKRIGDGHPAKMLAGLLQVGDEILEINGQSVKEEKSIDGVYDLILDKDDLALKVRPLVRRGNEIS